MIRILAVLVNYGSEQINYLKQVVSELKSFEKYDITIIVNSNVKINVEGIDRVNIMTLDDYELLPLTCRKVIWENREDYDVYIYGENDHLITENHVDKFLYYNNILPENRISGLIQFEQNEKGRYYPGYHLDFDWDYKSVEIYEGKKFAYFSNLHQATFIITKEQLKRIGDKINFLELINDYKLSTIKKIIREIKKKLGFSVRRLNIYSVKCKVNTDIYKYSGMKKMICISDFEENLIHHLPNVYIDGLAGRNKFRSDSIRMKEALSKLL